MRALAMLGEIAVICERCFTKSRTAPCAQGFWRGIRGEGKALRVRGAACVTHCQERALDPACASLSIPAMGWGKRLLSHLFFFL